ncbi:MAG: pseudouridine synthase [Elusimicrobiota bacterium]
MARKVIVFNKPYGIVTQFSPILEKRTLADFGLPKGVYPCGRLDHDSEGLLVLTDDGRLQNRITDPKRGHPRTYLVQVEGVPVLQRLNRLKNGLKLKDGMTKPCEVKLLQDEPALPPRIPPIRYRKSVPTSWLELSLTEGRNRQVRRMTAAISHPTLRLVRVRIGPLTLEGLEPGTWRPLTVEESRRLLNAVYDFRRTKSRTRSSCSRRSKGARS